MKRYWIAAGIGAACIFAVLGLAAFLPQSGVTKSQLDRVEIGMRLDQVESLFGRPADETLEALLSAPRANPEVTFLWIDDDGSVAAVFFEHRDGVVYGKQWDPSTETIGGKLRRSVRWPWW